MAAVTPARPLSNEQEDQKHHHLNKVFDSDDFDLLTSRIVRKHITIQLCDPDHPVLINEEKLINTSVSLLKKHLLETETEWGDLPFRLRKIMVIRHLRNLSIDRMKDHVETQDLDELIAQEAMNNIMALDFEEVFPNEWIDS